MYTVYLFIYIVFLSSAFKGLCLLLSQPKIESKGHLADIIRYNLVAQQKQGGRLVELKCTA